jgi:hypothetical protein
VAVLRHKHEVASGRTSSIAQALLGYDAAGRVRPRAPRARAPVRPRPLRFRSPSALASPPDAGPFQCANTHSCLLTPPPPPPPTPIPLPPRQVVNYSGVAPPTTAEVCAASARAVTLIDLGGHRAFLKTTLFGLTSTLPGAAGAGQGEGSGLRSDCVGPFACGVALISGRRPAFPPAPLHNNPNPQTMRSCACAPRRA